MALTLTWLAGAAVPAAGSRSAEAGSPSAYAYRFGVFPYLPALTIDRIFGPMAASFAAALDRPVYLKTKPTFEQFVAELRHETYDLVFVHPFFYVDAADRDGYLPLARLDGRLKAVVLVQSDRPWRAWADLAGKTIAAPPKLAAVSELARVALLDAGLVPGIDTTIAHYRTKVSCLHAVVVGAADACILPQFVLPQIDEIGDGKLRIMAESRAIAHLVFAAHPRVPETSRAKLQSLITSWPRTEIGRAILAAGSWSRFVPARDADYEEVRRQSVRLDHLAQR
jgi:phosphonate transport system substrate-binding protein